MINHCADYAPLVHTLIARYAPSFTKFIQSLGAACAHCADPTRPRVYMRVSVFSLFLPHPAIPLKIILSRIRD